MTVADLSRIAGAHYPAGRRTQNLVGGASPIQAKNFCMGYVTLEPARRPGAVAQPGAGRGVLHRQRDRRGVPGRGAQPVGAGQAVYIPPTVFHQLTNIGVGAAGHGVRLCPAGDVAHWRQELEGTLPRAGVDAPPLPGGARPQHARDSRQGGRT